MHHWVSSNSDMRIMRYNSSYTDHVGEFSRGLFHFGPDQLNLAGRNETARLVFIHTLLRQIHSPSTSIMLYFETSFSLTSIFMLATVDSGTNQMTVKEPMERLANSMEHSQRLQEHAYSCRKFSKTSRVIISGQLNCTASSLTGAGLS